LKKILVLLITALYSTSALSQTKIMALGESTTFDIRGAYRKKFCELANADGLSIDMIGPHSDGTGLNYDGDNGGFNGNPCTLIIDTLRKFYTYYSPDILLLLEGTNDCGWYYRYYLNDHPIIDELSLLIDEICLKYPETLVFVASIPPMSDSASFPAPLGIANENVTAYNNSIPGLINFKIAAGKKVSFIDMRQLLSIADITSDGIHPNIEGYNKIGEAFYNATKAFIVNIDTVINKKNQIIDFQSIPLKTYGDVNFTPIAAGTSGLQINFNSNNSSVATILKGMIHIVSAGTAIITASQSGDMFWNAAPDVIKTLTVNKSSLMATADDKSKTYGDINPPFTVSYSTFVGTDDPSVLDIPAVASSSATEYTEAGTYPIIVSGGSDNNYSFSYTPGMLAISIVTATIRLLEDMDIVVYPNPVTNHKMTIDLGNYSEKISLSLYSMTGQKVYSENEGYASSISVSLPEYLPKGIYFLKIENGIKEVIKSIIIE
jgi:lysophospholipase L1-like esterase